MVRQVSTGVGCAASLVVEGGHRARGAYRDLIFVMNKESSPTLPVKYCRQPVGGSLCEEHSTIVTLMNIYHLYIEGSFR